MKELKEIPNREFPKIKDFSMNLFIDLYKIQKCEFENILSDGCLNETYVNIRFLIKKENLIFFPELKKLSEYFSDFIKYNYERKSINNIFPLETYINDFEFEICFNYSPLKSKSTNNEDEENFVYFTPSYGNFYNYSLDMNKKNDCLLAEEFEKINDSFGNLLWKDHKNSFKIKEKEEEIFEMFINTLFFRNKKITVFEELLEYFGDELFEEKNKETYHLKRLHRQVLFESLEDMISSKINNI